MCHKTDARSNRKFGQSCLTSDRRVAFCTIIT
uniref:Uncharacterized protein n=1 Tax=Rhizophora mucronata TaxID=61149 RepID=A0A2P2L8X2_RHIMU